MPEARRFGLDANTLGSLTTLFAKHPEIERVILYGSRAKGTNKPGSDIDLALVAHGLDLTDLLRIENELEELLLPYKVDLSLLHQIENADLIDHIRKVGVDLG